MGESGKEGKKRKKITNMAFVTRARALTLLLSSVGIFYGGQERGSMGMLGEEATSYCLAECAVRVT